MNTTFLPIDQLSTKLLELLPALMHENHIPGLSLAIIQNNTISKNLHFGVKNSVTEQPIDSFTVFEGASFTKPLLGYSALQMCQQGIFHLDTPLRNYLHHPYLSDPPLLSQVTLRHILFHTAGFPEDILGIKQPLVLQFTPGEKYLYAQEGFHFLAHVMETLVGKPLPVYLQEHVLKPLSMQNSCFIWDERYDNQAASPHNWAGMPIKKWKPKRLIGSCSLHTTPTDYAKFMIEVLKQAETSPSTNFLNMLDVRIKVEKNISWGLGWGIEDTPEGEVIFHAGNTNAFKSLAMIYRQQRFGFVFMTNSPNSYRIFPEIIGIAMGNHHQPLIDFEEFLLEDEKNINMDEKHLWTWWDKCGI